MCFQQGIFVLQQKVAGIISELTGSAQGPLANGPMDADDEYRPQSPRDMGVDDQDAIQGGNTVWGGNQTSYGGYGGYGSNMYGGHSAWGQ
jgi:hypothetical protein